MLAKITTKNQLTLPKAVMQQVGRTEYVEVTFENGRIILRLCRCGLPTL